MKFPYGISDFYQLVTEDFFYVDRTGHLPHIEEAGKQLLFLRPRRFGKSLLLSMLENYYDIKKADEFQRLFGHLAIGRNPTPKRNQYFVLKWDFSSVPASDSPEQVQESLHKYLNQQIEDFGRYYEDLLAYPIAISPENAIPSFQSLLSAVRHTKHRLYLLIDEYDNFANEILMSKRPADQSSYESVLQGEGALKSIFKAVKAGASGSGLDRVFITGIAPIVLTDMTSGYNVAKSIYLEPEFHDLCGFTEAEVADALKQAAGDSGWSGTLDPILSQMRLYYNGYGFSDEPGPLVYNPMLALYFLDYFQRRHRAPSNLLDRNLAMDDGKLSYIAEASGGAELIVEALKDDARLSVPVLEDRFGARDLLRLHQGHSVPVSLLYYFGVLTLVGLDEYDALQLQIPNLVIRKLYADQLQALLLPEAKDQQTGRRAAEDLFRDGNPQPLCEFVEQYYFKVFDNRDYIQANELTIKTAFLTLLFDNSSYIMDSETVVGRRYADLTMILRPEARKHQRFDLLLEFKFVKLGEAGVSGEEARQMKQEALASLPPIRQKLAEARAQAADYLRELQARYHAEMSVELRPRVYAIVALGFERLVWEEIPETG